MVQTSALYLLYCGLIALLVWGLRSLGRRTVFILIAASLFFYATWNPFYCLPLLATAALDFLVGRKLAQVKGKGLRRSLLGLSLGVNLALLGFFKYFNFTLDTANALASRFGWTLLAPGFSVVFMVGISFYTFQSMGYVLDMYRREYEPTDSFLDYLGFVSFFPALLAGPISRADHILPQLRKQPESLSAEALGKGLFLIALGFLKKKLIADYLAVTLVNRIFELPGMYSSLEVLAGLYAYAIQIYGDFSGYSDIAQGSALLLGIKLKDNFNCPYRATDLTDFWRRWHITLSTWLRDYVFFSLPGKRPGTPWPYANLIVTFTLGGLWHGASWNYVLWGLLHGFGLAGSKFFAKARGTQDPPWKTGLKALLTFHYVLLTWIFFRCDTFDQALDILKRLGALSLGAGNVPWLAVAAIVGVLAFQWWPESWYRKAMDSFVAFHPLLQTACLVTAALGVHLASTAGVAEFIYFGF